MLQISNVTKPGLNGRASAGTIPDWKLQRNLVFRVVARGVSLSDVQWIGARCKCAVDLQILTIIRAI